MTKYSTAFGMDVHLRSTTVCALDADTGEAVTRRFPGNPWGEIAGWMDGFPGPSLAAYESGYLGFAPQRELAGLGVECVVAAVSKIPRSAADSASKNDRNDAARMAKAILAHDISPVWVPHYSLKWATDKFRWRAFGALPTIRASPEGPPIGRLRMAVCPCPVEGPGGVATGGARRSGRLIGNCRAQAPRPGNVGVAGGGSDRPTDWRITPWHHLECRKPSSGSMSGNCPIGHASRPGTARYC